MSFSSSDFYTISPIIVLTMTGFVNVILGMVFKNVSNRTLLCVSLVGFALTALTSLDQWGGNVLAFGGLITADDLSIVFCLMFVGGASLSSLLAVNRHEEAYLLYPEFFAIISFATVGMLLMATSTNLLVIFMGLETLSISLYILAGLKRNESKSLESAFKYFLLGAFASAFLLYGISFLYGASGSLDLAKIADFVAGHRLEDTPLMILGGFLILVGLGFKVAIFPFHMWAPDVYQGAPTPVTAYMSTGSKAAAFAVMLRISFSATNGAAEDWVLVLGSIAVLTMFVGNLSAIVQKNIKRMLAYSSVAHAGYVLVGVVTHNEFGSSAVVFYLLSYTFMNIGAFGVLIYLGTAKKECLELDDLKGLGYKKPWLALTMAIFMFSLAGLPPTAGFFGKFYIFASAVKSGYLSLAVIGVINAMISLYYYLGVVVVMFMKGGDDLRPSPDSQPAVSLSLGLAGLGTMFLGIFPSYLLHTLEQAMLFIN